MVTEIYLEYQRVNPPIMERIHRTNNASNPLLWKGNLKHRKLKVRPNLTLTIAHALPLSTINIVCLCLREQVGGCNLLTPMLHYPPPPETHLVNINLLNNQHQNHSVKIWIHATFML